MSCKACEEAQQSAEPMVYPYRWKNANILVLGCKEHIKEIFDVLNAYQTREKTPNK